MGSVIFIPARINHREREPGAVLDDPELHSRRAAPRNGVERRLRSMSPAPQKRRRGTDPAR